MTLPFLNRKIENARWAREEGRPQEALQSLRSVIVQAQRMDEPLTVVSAMSELVVCYQHLYLTTGQVRHLDQMRDFAQQGLQLALTPHNGSSRALHEQSSIFEYRLGVAEFLKGEYKQAAAHFKAALAEISPRSTQYPEYAAYLGISKVLTRRPKQGFALLNSALRRIQRTRKKYEATHAQIIESGVLIKLAEAFGRSGRIKEAQQLAPQIETITSSLRKQGKGIRHEQWRKLQKELEI